jgi:YD repeat-containing protein
VETVTLDGLPVAAGESKTLTMTYDDNGRLETRTDRRGAVTEFRYNEVNLTREIILPASTAAPGRRNILLGYDSMNRPSTLENLNGHTTSRTYDTRGRLHTIVNGLSQTVLTRTYYDNNLVKTETDGAGITTEYTWDANNRLVRKTGLGNLADSSDDVSIEYPLYDAEGQPLTIRDPRGIFTHLKYDNAGRRTQSVVVKQGQNTNRDAALADPANFHQHFTFDRNSQMKSFTDPMGHTTNFFYDVMKRLDHYTDAANRTWDYTYYDNGLPHTITTPDNRTTTYTFDAANRLDYIQYHEAQVFADFGYDANGNQTSLQDQYGTTSSAFDSRNQMTSSTDSFGQTVGYDYFPGGNLKNLTYPGNHVVAYTWDAAERMKTVTPLGRRHLDLQLPGQLPA